LLFAAACASPNTYGTPRTTPAGATQHTLFAEGFDGRDKTDSVASAGVGYMLRAGLSDRVDLGVRVTTGLSAGADLKVNFVRGDAFDVAFDPGAQAVYYAPAALCFACGAHDWVETGILHADLPFLFAWNANRRVSFVASAGATFSGTTGPVPNVSANLPTTRGTFGRIGLGIDLRLTRRFAIHPEVTSMLRVDGPATLLTSYGLGFTFGALPRYDEATER
jgi:hypothetical protein